MRAKRVYLHVHEHARGCACMRVSAQKGGKGTSGLVSFGRERNEGRVARYGIQGGGAGGGECGQGVKTAYKGDTEAE